jgi:glycosyltransferase involved in cell wall biosynthesis
MAEQAKTFRAWSRSFVLSAAYGIVVYSDSVKNWYSKNFGNLNVEICPNIQNPESLLASAKRFHEITPEYIEKFDLHGCKIALYVGRLTEVKGLDLLIHAFAKSENKNFKLVIVGDGNLKESLKELAQEIGIEKKIVFAGRYDGDRLYAWYSIANFFILPSRYEPFGAVVNESLVLGTPVVASKYIGALDFIKEGENGSVFDPLNEIEFVNILNRSMREFENKLEPGKNLMVTSFNDHVKAFSKFAS